MNTRSLGMLVVLVVLASSCTTSYLTTSSLRNQFEGIDSSKLRSVTVRGPIGERYHYLANPINTINCTDKAGNPLQLTNSPSIEMRVTLTDGKRSIFYFDRIFVTDSTVTGIQSRFLSSIKKTISFRDIRKIEIQDGKKNFVYVSE